MVIMFANWEVSVTSMRLHFDEAFQGNLEDRGEDGEPPKIAFKVRAPTFDISLTICHVSI